MGRLGAAALAVLAAAGCLPPAFVCPTKGGAEWREYRTQHFVLRTDRSPNAARALALELEQIRDAVAHTLFRSPPRAAGVVQVVALRTWSEFALFADRGVAGFFTMSSWGEPTIVLPAPLGSAQRAVVAHELAHMLGAADSRRRPPWFREGTACYVETIDFHGPDANVMLGGVPPHRAHGLLYGPGDLERLLTERDSLRGAEYDLAWALVHFLFNEHPEELGALEDRFAAGEDPRAAWRAVFPQWAAGDGIGLLRDALEAYFEVPAKVYVYRHARLASIPPPVERVLGPAEIHDMRLALRWPNRGKPVSREQRLAEAREALAEDPGSPTAVAVLASEKGADRRALAERATAARPGDARNWVLLALALPAADVAGRDAALRRAVATDPTNRFALVALASHLLETKRAREALAPARNAVELVPWSAAALDTAAGVLDALGQCRNALDLEERALAYIGETADDEVRKPAVERRDRLARACGARVDGGR